jgi:tight adherence protein C
MTPAAVLAASAVLLAGAAWREVTLKAGGRADRAFGPGRSRPAARAALRLGLPARLRRAGMEEVPMAAILLAKLACGAVGAMVGLAAAPAAPGRLPMLVAAALPVAGFLGPDAMLERRARHRHRRLIGALPDALDLLAVSAAAGRSPISGFGELARGDGPLARELAMTVAEIRCGRRQPDALRALRERAPGPELAAVCAAIERSTRLGSPLAELLRRQSSGLRQSQRRDVEERAARAAPKIQLVVALVLVPSVLLMIVAGLVANADRLIGGF